MTRDLLTYRELMSAASPPRPGGARAGQLFCGRCQGLRTVDAAVEKNDVQKLQQAREQHRSAAEKRARAKSAAVAAGSGPASVPDLPPFDPAGSGVRLPMTTIVRVTCRQCNATWLLLAIAYDYQEKEVEVREIGRPGGSIATPNTPKPVREYLEEATITRSAGAYIASVAMFRAALEAVLMHQGFNKRMLGPKIGQLKVSIESGKAPAWAGMVTPDVLGLFQKLGNWALHPDADQPRGEVLDRDLALAAEKVLEVLLDEIYEAPRRHEQRVSALKEAVMRTKGG